MVVSESCIEYTKFGAADGVVNAGRLSHEIIGDLNGGMCAFYDWNLLLDETGGPNHVGNLCHAPFLYDRHHKELLPQLIQKYFTILPTLSNPVPNESLSVSIRMSWM